MNRTFLNFRRTIAPVLAVATAAILFTACLKNKDNDYQDIPAAGLMAFNLAPDQESVVIALNNNSLTQQPLQYTNFTGVYQPVYTGNRAIAAFNYPSNAPLASVNYNFEQDKYYSLFVLGYDSSYRNVVTFDDIDSLPSGKAYIRYINGITDSINSSNVTVTTSGTPVFNDNAAYANVSGFQALSPGDVSVTVKSNNGVDANRTFTVENNKVYTVLLIGVPGATDDRKKVQIKYITNGTITDDTNQ